MTKYMFAVLAISVSALAACGGGAAEGEAAKTPEPAADPAAAAPADPAAAPADPAAAAPADPAAAAPADPAAAPKK